MTVRSATSRQAGHRPSRRRSGSALALAGLLILLSLVAPAGLAAFTDWSWAVGLALVGLGVLAVALGSVRLYPLVSDGAPGLAVTGVAAAAVAALAALGLVGFVGVAVVGEAVLGVAVPRPFEAFALVTVAMGGGFAVALLAYGAAGLRTAALPRPVAGLLAAGGLVLLAPVVVELAGSVGSFDTPRWLGFPAIAFAAVDVLVVGVALRFRDETGAADNE